MDAFSDCNGNILHYGGFGIILLILSFLLFLIKVEMKCLNYMDSVVVEIMKKSDFRNQINRVLNV